MTSTSVLAASTDFQDPALADWGGWARGDAGTLYVHWEEFDACTPAGGFCGADIDTSPDAGNVGTAAASLNPLTESAFITGNGAGGNIYSFSDPQDFEVQITPLADFAVPVRVALQVAIVATDLDDDSVTLGGVPFDEKVVLVEQFGDTPFGPGLDNEYLYLWNSATPGETLEFELSSLSSSLSLDALAVDAAAVPLPAAAWLLLSSLGVLALRRRRG